MSSAAADDLEFGPPSELDEKAIRRAIRRGVLRTAFAAVGWFLLASILLQLVANGWLVAGGRREQMDNVVLMGIQVGYPEFNPTGWGCCNRSLTTLTGFLDLTLRSPDAFVPALELRPTQDLSGRFDPFSVSIPETSLGSAIQGLGVNEDTAAATLQQLPAMTNVSAVVLFNSPLEQTEVEEVLQAAGLPSFEAALLFDVPRDARWVGSRSGTKERIGWPEVSFRQFQAWAGTLSSSDDTTLHELGLPRAADIETIASGGSSGLVIGSMTRGSALGLLDHPFVRTILATEVEFDLVER